MATDVKPDDFSGHFVDPFEVCSSSVFITIGLLTLFVYIRIVKYHIKYGFKTHFQKMFLVCLTNDLLMHYGLLFRIRLPTWGVYEFFWNVQEGVIPAILAVSCMFSILFQELGTLLIAINRATSLAFPHHYEWFWSRFTWHTCIGCALFCSLYTGPAFTDSSFFYRASWGYYIPYTLRQSPLTQALYNGYFPLCLSIVFICFLVNIYTCIRLYFHSKTMQRGINRREMAFHVLTVFQFIIQAVNTGDMIITNTQSMADFWFFFEFSPVFSDLTNFLPIWFLLLISEETRMIVTGKLKGRDGVHTKTAVSTISTQNSPRLPQSSTTLMATKSTNPQSNHSRTVSSNMYGNA